MVPADFANPEKIIQSLGIVTPAMNIADFGCGAGYFTIPLAKLVGEQGRVHAFDILESALSAAKHKVTFNKLTNIELTRTNLETHLSTRLPSGSIDLVFAANILFQSDRKEDILQEAKRVLRPGGTLGIIEWDDASSLGPSAYKIPKASLRQLIETLGFFFIKEFNAGSHHYGMLFRNA